MFVLKRYGSLPDSSNVERSSIFLAQMLAKNKSEKKDCILNFGERILFFLVLFSPPEKMFTVEISPGPQIAAQIGHSVVLTCDVRDCESPSFSWRTQIDSPLNGKVRSQGSKSTLTLSPVSVENEHFYLCTVMCGQKKLEKGIQVKPYCKWFSELFTVLLLLSFPAPLEEAEWKSAIHNKILVFRKEI